MQLSWVKVKGHSKEEGNDAADRMVGFAQNGGEKNVQDISMMMELLVFPRDGGTRVTAHAWGPHVTGHRGFHG